ncbi:hypothetical protein M422DRAFT_245575 [Sphaerobolus stellatus SS14]|nr:hypothetical protein M422DRAFT_245575 [Sphaerobolus stellatus SS14]
MFIFMEVTDADEFSREFVLKAGINSALAHVFTRGMKFYMQDRNKTVSEHAQQALLKLSITILITRYCRTLEKSLGVSKGTNVYRGEATTRSMHQEDSGLYEFRGKFPISLGVNIDIKPHDRIRYIRASSYNIAYCSRKYPGIPLTFLVIKLDYWTVPRTGNVLTFEEDAQQSGEGLIPKWVLTMAKHISRETAARNMPLLTTAFALGGLSPRRRDFCGPVTESAAFVREGP